MQRAPITVLLNDRAGLRVPGGTSVEARLVALVPSDCTPLRVRPLPAEAIVPEIEAIRAAGAERIGVAGGDGTIAAAAGALAGGSTALLPVPTGTLNHFARRLGYERPEDALRSAGVGEVGRVPAGFVDDRIFLNTGTFGGYAEVVRLRDRLRPYLTKWGAAFLASALSLLRLRTLDVVVQVEGEYLRRSTPLVWVGIGWGSFPRVIDAAERRSSPDLEVVVLRPGGRFGLLRLLVRLARHLAGGPRPIPDRAIEVIHTRSLLIHASHPIDVTLDGEPCRLQPPLFVAVQDEALRVVLPSAVG
jgi:diacylglycerol kinase family enzyme